MNLVQPSMQHRQVLHAAHAVCCAADLAWECTVSALCQVWCSTDCPTKLPYQLVLHAIIVE
jgi:hypothetical protein